MSWLDTIGERGDVDATESLNDARERLHAAWAHASVHPLDALDALADARVNVEAAMLILVRQLRLSRPPASWDSIANALGIHQAGGARALRPTSPR